MRPLPLVRRGIGLWWRLQAEGRRDIGGIQIDEAVTRAFIAALEPAKLAATLAAAERLESDREATLASRLSSR